MFGDGLGSGEKVQPSAGGTEPALLNSLGNREAQRAAKSSTKGGKVSSEQPDSAASLSFLLLKRDHALERENEVLLVGCLFSGKGPFSLAAGTEKQTFGPTLSSCSAAEAGD